jgi:hypothetical protein
MTEASMKFSITVKAKFIFSLAGMRQVDLNFFKNNQQFCSRKKY